MRNERGASAERTRRTRGANAAHARSERELFHAGGVSFSASVGSGSSPREARKFFSDLLFNGQETALVVSRYIEGHHAYCFSHYRPTSNTQPAHSTSRSWQNIIITIYM